MEVGLVMDIAIEALTVMVLIASPVLGAALATGLIIGILQAATSIQEMTLTFVPKIIIIFAAVIVFMPFMMTSVLEFSNTLFDMIVGLG